MGNGLTQFAPVSRYGARSGGFGSPINGIGDTTIGARRRAAFGVRTSIRPAVIRPRYYYSGIFVIMLVGLLLRVWNLGGASLWSDEALTALRAQAPLATSFTSLVNTGNQTPVYFWMLRVFPTSTEALLRLPSALLGVVGIALFMLTVRRLYQDREMELWAGALLAVNPFHVWLSRTARPYSMMFLGALLASYFFLLLLRGHRSRWLWAAYVVTSLVTYATHFSALALPAAQYVVFGFVLREKVAIFRKWIAAQVLAAGPALMWTYIMLHDSVEVKSHWIPVPELRDIPLTLWNMTLGYDGDFKWYMVPALMLVTLGLVFGLGVAVEERRKNLNNLYWLWLVTVPLIPIFLLSHFAVSIYVDRYFMVFLPALLLLVVVGWMKYSRSVWRVALAILIVTGGYNVIFSFYSGTYQRADWRGAARYVAEGFQAGDTIVVGKDYAREVFTRYYTGESFVPGAAPSPKAPIVLLASLESGAEIDRPSERVWAVYRNPIDDVHRIGQMPDFDPFDPSLSEMGRWLSERQDQVVQQRTYNGIRVLLLDPHGRLAEATSQEPSRTAER